MKRQPHRPNADGVAVSERHGRRHSLVAAKRSVLAATVFEDCGVGRHDDTGMVAGDGGRVESDCEIGIPSDDVFADRKWKSPATHFEPAEASWRCSTRIGQHAVTAERIAQRCGLRTNQARAIIERRPNFGHEVREVVSGTKVPGQRRSVKSVFDSAFGRSSTSADSSSNAFGSR